MDLECKRYGNPTRIHRPRGHIVHAHTSRLQFLADTPGEVLHWRFRSGICGIESGESSQQGRDNRYDLAIIGDVSGSRLENEESSLGVDTVLIRQSGHSSLSIL